jgi:hypothetical protein
LKKSRDDSAVQFVLNEFVNILQESPEVVAENISLGRPDIERVKKLPLVAIYDSGFEIEELGFGSNFGESKEEKSEQLSGDGKTTEFKLQNKPLKPLSIVKIAKQSAMREPNDFRVDYASGNLIFRSPPPKGKNNVIVNYTIAKSVSEIKGLRIRIQCLIDMWAKDSAQCDSITLGVMKTILISCDKLSKSGISVRPVKCIEISSENNIITKGPKNLLFGRRLVYVADTNVTVEIKVPTIKEIQISNID